MRLGVGAALVDGVLVRGDVEVADGLVRGVGLTGGGAGRGIAAPGFIDLQVNGIAGVDLLGADPDDYAEAGRALTRTGVTAYQPTFITSRPERIDTALETLAAVAAEPAGALGGAPAPAAPRVLGAHLEGPFISPDRAGTHTAELILDPDPELADRWLRTGLVRMVTLAPERPGGLELVAQCTVAGATVSCGHTDADAAVATDAFDRGARSVTHLFNAMRAFHHRDPGVVGVALGRPDVTIGLIVDLIHLAPETVAAVWQAAAGRVCLVTDATAAAGMDDGEFQLGDVRVSKRGLEVRRADGTLAGSALTMDAAVRNLVDLGVPVEAALDAASGVPAQLVGDERGGRLAPGTPADVVVLDDDLAVRGVLVGGEEVG